MPCVIRNMYRAPSILHSESAMAVASSVARGPLILASACSTNCWIRERKRSRFASAVSSTVNVELKSSRIMLKTACTPVKTSGCSLSISFSMDFLIPGQKPAKGSPFDIASFSKVDLCVCLFLPASSAQHGPRIWETVRLTCHLHTLVV